MLGNQFLVAPMVSKGEAREMKLTKGSWVDGLDKKIQRRSERKNGCATQSACNI